MKQREIDLGSEGVKDMRKHKRDETVDGKARRNTDVTLVVRRKDSDRK